MSASNATLLAIAELDCVEVTCVYKHTSGERPLWDVDEGTLGMREVAAHDVSTALGWNIVPPTVWREDGPFGQGMAQAWVNSPDDAEPEPGAGLVDIVDRDRTPHGWLEVVEAQGENGRPIRLIHADHPDLRRMCVFDAIINNADRKGGHVLVGRVRPGDEVRTYGVDHGVTFSTDEKLRTVLWGFAGTELDGQMMVDLEHLAADLGEHLGEALSELLTRRELARTSQRLSRLMREGAYPLPGDGWPSLPWPAF